MEGCEKRFVMCDGNEKSHWNLCSSKTTFRTRKRNAKHHLLLPKPPTLGESIEKYPPICCKEHQLLDDEKIK